MKAKMFTAFAAASLMMSVIVSGCSSSGKNNQNQSAGASATIGTSKSGDAAGSKPQQEPVTIRVLGTSGYEETITAKIAEELKKKNIKVEGEFYDWTTWDGKQKLAMTSQGGDYDVIFLPGAYIPLWANAKAAQPMDDFMKKFNYNENDYYKSVLDYAKVDGHWYMSPVSAEAMVLFYRTDLYKAAGLNPPKTIDEMYNTAKQLTKDNMFGLAYPGGPGEGASSFWSYFFWSYGGKYYNEAMKPQLNTPEAVQSAEMFAKILKDTAPRGVATWQDEETISAFSAGNVAAIVTWPAYIGMFGDQSKSKIVGKYAVATVPAGPSGKAVPRFGAWGLSVTSNSKQKDAAYEYIHEFTKQETMKEISGYISTAFKSINNDPELQKKNPTLPAVGGVLDTAQERPSLPESGQINTLVGNAINSIVAGKPAKETLDQLQTNVDKIMGDAGYYKK